MPFDLTKTSFYRIASHCVATSSHRFLMTISTIVLLLVLLPSHLSAKMGGLAFLNPANSIEHRTSYSVFGDNEPEFSGCIDISFDMRLPYREEVGYVMRIIDRRQKKTFNVFFDVRGDNYFALNREGYKSLIRISFDRKELRRKQWFRVQVRFDLVGKTVSMAIDGKRQQAELASLSKKMKAEIVFGRSDYLIDVPSFAMRNLRVADNTRQWMFPLKQTSGNVVRDDNGRAVGTVTAPYWLINDHYHWKAVSNFASATPAGHNYDAATHNIIYYNRDTIHTYDVMSGTSAHQTFVSPCPVHLYLGTCFIDSVSRRLYSYEVFRNEKADDDYSVASLDLDTYQWQSEATVQINEGQMHHHGAFYRPDTRQFTIYGGFANMRYNDMFYSYDVPSHRWTMHHDVRGERFPRYFPAMGYDGRRYAYIFGGMGNESGDQTVGRRFFYDLHRYDTRTQRVDKLWSAKWDGRSDMVFSHYMVLMRDSFYVLGYSEFKSNSYMRLYRFSLRDGNFCQIGDSIPIHPDRIETETSLFYDPLLHRFIAAVQEYRDESHSTLRTYTIDAPAVSESAYHTFEYKQSRFPWIPIAVAAVAFMTAAFVLFRLRRRRMRRHKVEVVVPTTVKPNSVCIFGTFTAFGRNGRDISYLFTEKLRLLFCIILQNNAQGGISSQRLGYEMWGDKSPEKIKNSKSVAINHLRKVLKEFDGITLVYDSGKFMFCIEPSFYCDHLALTTIISDADSKLYARRADVFEVLHRGKFLAGMDTPILDSFKSATETMLLKPLLALMDAAAEQSDHASVLLCVKYIFYIDPINEPAFHAQTRALKRLGKTVELKEAVIHFNDAYKQTYGEPRQE